MNVALFSTIFSIAATTIIGVLMIVLFVNDMGNMQTVLGAVVAGFLVSLPIAFGVSKKLSTLTGKPETK